MRTSGKQVALGSVLVAGALLTQIRGQAGAPVQTPTPTPAAPPVTLPLTSLKPDAVIDAGADVMFSVTSDALWVASRSSGTLRRFDPKTNASTVSLETSAAGKGPCQPPVSAFRTLWVPLCESQSLHRFELPPDPAATSKPAEKPSPVKAAEEQKTTGHVAVQIGTAGPLLTATGSIWMISDAAGTLARIDPDTSASVAEVQIPPGANAIAFGMNAIWITSSTRDVVTRVHAETNVVEETIKVGKRPLSVAVGEGSVWVMNGGDSTVSRIDAKTNKVAETIKTGVTATTGTIVIGEGSVWLSAPGTPLTRIDPVSNRMVQQFTGSGGGALAIGLKSLWLAASPTAIWRIDPKRVEATRR